MKKLTSAVLVVIMLTASLLLTSQTVTTAQTQLRTAQSQRTPGIKNVEAKRGVEVAARVKGLRRESRNVNAALRLFEKWTSAKD
jgi:curli biogenesis system outer membrane secretion channel CsgG